MRAVEPVTLKVVSAELLPRLAPEAALRRVVDFYLHTAHAADRLLYPQPDLTGCLSGLITFRIGLA